MILNQKLLKLKKKISNLLLLKFQLKQIYKLKRQNSKKKITKTQKSKIIFSRIPNNSSIKKFMKMHRFLLLNYTPMDIQCAHRIFHRRLFMKKIIIIS